MANHTRADPNKQREGHDAVDHKSNVPHEEVIGARMKSHEPI